MKRDDTADGLVDLVLDKYCGEILTATSAAPLPVTDIVETCDMSTATAYRRIDELVKQDLLERLTLVNENGDQFSVYAARFHSLKLEIVNGFAYLHVVQPDDHRIIRIWKHGEDDAKSGNGRWRGRN